jgi:hypothetical protein
VTRIIRRTALLLTLAGGVVGANGESFPTVVHGHGVLGPIWVCVP